jgi:copper(I)-binding protein
LDVKPPEIFRRCAAGLAASAFTFLAPAALAAGVFVVSYPWAPPAAKGAATEVFMELTAVDGGALVGARSDIAGNASLVGPGKAAAPVERLALVAGAPVVLAPGSYRVRLSGLTQTLKLGDRVPLVLIVEAPDGKRVEVIADAEVLRRSTVDEHLSGHHH